MGSNFQNHADKYYRKWQSELLEDLQKGNEIPESTYEKLSKVVAIDKLLEHFDYNLHTQKDKLDLTNLLLSTFDKDCVYDVLLAIRYF